MQKPLPPPAPDRPTQVRWLIFALACGTSWLLYLHRYAWGVVKPAVKAEYPELSDVELGWLDSAFNASYAVFQVPGGLAGDVFGQRGVLGGSILLWSVLVACLGWVPGFWRLLLIRLAFGTAQAATYPSLSQVTRRWFPLSVRGTVQGAVATLSGRAGGACASLVVATLLMGLLGLSWSAALLILAVFGLAFALAFLVLFRNSPGEHPLANDAERQEVEGGGTRGRPGHPAGAAAGRLGRGQRRPAAAPRLHQHVLRPALRLLDPAVPA